MTSAKYKPGLPVYYLSRDGDTIPAILIMLSGGNKSRCYIEGDFATGRTRRLVSLKNCEPQMDVLTVRDTARAIIAKAEGRE